MGERENWNGLIGQQVRVQRPGRTIRTGYVEAVTEAADALWSAAHGIDRRALYEKGQDHTALLTNGHEGADHGHHA